MYLDGGTPTFVGCRFVSNYGTEGGAVCLQQSDAVFINCSFVANESVFGQVYLRGLSTPLLQNCIIAFAQEGPAINCNGYTDGPTFVCCNIFGNDSGDYVPCIADQLNTARNISVNPDFCDAGDNDLQIFNLSPCAPSNNECGVLIGADSVECFAVCGDCNTDTLVNVSDVVYLIQYIFAHGPGPYPSAAGDADCNGIVNVSDAVYLIAYIFGGGPSPCAL